MSAALEFLYRVLGLLALALAIRVVVDVWLEIPYSILLILVGVGISIHPIEIGLRLSHDVIMSLVLPLILFNGAIELNRRLLHDNIVVPLVLVVVGIPLAVALLGAATAAVFGLPVLIALLLAGIVVPTDPIAVLSLFEEIDAPERLSVIIDSESLFNDGVAVVIVNVLLVLIAERPTLTGSSEIATTVVLDLFVVGVGGFLIGAVLGYTATQFMRRVPERMAILLSTVLVAYGSYVLATSVVGVSGILATVGAGLFVETTPSEGIKIDPDILEFVRDTWEGGAFLLSTLVYVLIGAQVPIDSLVRRLEYILVAAVLVLLVRAVVVYSLVGIMNVIATPKTPPSYQHMLVWGGLHTVVPIALALGLPAGLPRRDFIQAVVFGVAVTGALVQGLLMPTVLRVTGIRERASRVGTLDRTE
ncbi:sodium:proton antiporter [Natrinema hispanicum]|uniref:Sodium/proton antiporter, CPA1 family n=1 Tax=Natrinema hispanicum TaxID=392421 RepID=A0A1G6KUA2_9EURY|nr:cation:proton antiporter [Natrinema hispanicum]SDC34065.1 sodium/proton antiporter, CPA1 family [Natrinema hispanicum]SET06406.1 sodium/proton antiporter, CPA1 family [Natrinema hispanicum]